MLHRYYMEVNTKEIAKKIARRYFWGLGNRKKTVGRENRSTTIFCSEQHRTNPNYVGTESIIKFKT